MPPCLVCMPSPTSIFCLAGCVLLGCSIPRQPLLAFCLYCVCPVHCNFCWRSSQLHFVAMAIPLGHSASSQSGVQALRSSPVGSQPEPGTVLHMLESQNSAASLRPVHSLCFWWCWQISSSCNTDAALSSPDTPLGHDIGDTVDTHPYLASCSKAHSTHLASCIGLARQKLTWVHT